MKHVNRNDSLYPKDLKKRGGSGMLVNKLSIKDAEDIIRKEGGTMTYSSMAFRAAVALTIAGFVARAILQGNATAVHLMLPSVAEYLGLLLMLPIVALIVPHEAIKKEARGGIKLLLFLSAIAAGWITWQSRKLGFPWMDTAGSEAATLWEWIANHQMHWPMLGAVFFSAIALPGRVRLLKKYGPPFYAVSLGCGMRVAILFLGIFLIPLVAGSSERVTWALWGLLLLGELLAIYMHWDLQTRLKKLDISV